MDGEWTRMLRQLCLPLLQFACCLLISSIAHQSSDKCFVIAIRKLFLHSCAPSVESLHQQVCQHADKSQRRRLCTHSPFIIGAWMPLDVIIRLVDALAKRKAADDWNILRWSDTGINAPCRSLIEYDITLRLDVAF